MRQEIHPGSLMTQREARKLASYWRSYGPTWVEIDASTPKHWKARYRVYRTVDTKPKTAV